MAKKSTLKSNLAKLRGARRVSRRGAEGEVSAEPAAVPPVLPLSVCETKGVIVLQANSKRACGIDLSNGEVIRACQQHGIKITKDSRGNVQGVLAVELFDH